MTRETSKPGAPSNSILPPFALRGRLPGQTVQKKLGSVLPESHLARAQKWFLWFLTAGPGLIVGLSLAIVGTFVDADAIGKNLCGLDQALIPLNNSFDAQELRKTLRPFDVLLEAAEPKEMQQLIRTLVHCIEWQPNGETHFIEFYALGKTKNQSLSKDKDWFETNIRPT